MDKVPKKRALAKAKVIKVAQTKNVVVLPVKKAITKKTVKKTVSTKVDSKLKSSTKVTKKLPIKEVINKSNRNSEEVKLVPGTISLRLAEKRRLYERVYRDYVPKVMRPVAISSGYAYVTAGIFLAVLMASPNLSNLVSQTATAFCFSGECQTAITTEAKSSISPIEFRPLAPILPGSDTNLQVALNLNIPIRLSLLPISGGAVMTITGVAESASNLVNFLLPTASLSNGSYLIQAELYDVESGQIRVKHIGPTIEVANVLPEVTVPQEVSVIPAEEPAEELTSEAKDVLGISTSTTETDLETITEGDVEKETVLASVVEDTELTKVDSLEGSEVFSLTLVPGTIPNQSIIKILPTFVFDKVEILLRSKGEGETFFLGQATKAGEDWIFWLDNKTIPNGPYNLIIRGFDTGEFRNEATFTFANKIKPILTEDGALTEIENRVNALLSEELDIEDLTSMRASYLTTYLETSGLNYPDDYLSDYLPELDDFFANYASAVAGGNESLLILADEQIEKYLDTMIVNDDTGQSFAYELSALLLNTKNYIRAKEAEVIRLSGGDSAFDSDKDGFTDYDEVVIHGTDPILPDSDNDSFLDSVETILGYNPIDEKLEAVARHTDSIKSGISNDELLGISAVEPLYFYTENSEVPKVFTSVSGKAIPNSFVRLYLGELSESILVRVGGEGIFTQTIDKDFSTVAGEVTLALTDNTGRTVMRSESEQPAKLIINKQLNNSTAADASVIKSIEDFKSNNIIGALGVVSFGLTLLLLGKALVLRKETVSLEIT